MAGDASGDRREGDDRTRDRPAEPTDERTTVRNVRGATDAGSASDGDRIPIDLSSDAARDGERRTHDESEDDPYGPEPSSTPIEPGDPALENVLFVVLGAAAMLLVLVRVVSLPF
ncbi:DUF7312 domain-containing protein [Natronococcus jeotgali]|uniref:DUF7312 domain-containing protein n=1 Tax=Natronococcus jeotgali DSM 18795 TaxID=1227498 RepID=L9WSD7_9EURY|nr:hypothetical protein [Natronococcus jeotgali]ELY51223.1 hypothetical protein C492_21160 [Natronococcus jeotgali DSM 18795]